MNLMSNISTALSLREWIRLVIDFKFDNDYFSFSWKQTNKKAYWEKKEGENDNDDDKEEDEEEERTEQNNV